MSINQTQSTMNVPGRFQNEQVYWLKKLHGDIEISTFPYDIKTNTDHAYEVQCVKHQFPNEIFNRLIAISKQSDYALYMILLSAVEYLLHQYTENDDLLVVMPVFKQNHDTGTRINNILPLRMQVHPCKTFKDLLSGVKNMVSEANLNQNFPILSFTKNLNLQLAPDGTPILNTVVLLNTIHDREYLGDLQSDTVFLFSRDAEGLKLELEFNAKRYRKQTMKAILTHLEGFLRCSLKQPGISLADIDILSEEENQWLKGFARGDVQVYDSTGQGHTSIDVLLEDGLWQEDSTKQVLGEEVYVLNNNGKLQPVGIPGELCFSVKEGVEALGEALEFIATANIKGKEQEMKIVKTGHVVRWISEGCLEYRGHREQRAKIKGHILNLKEIEDHLISVEGIQQASVLANHDEKGNAYISAFVVSEEEVLDFQIKGHLGKVLPGYAIPSKLMKVGQIPLKLDGKVDKEALFELERQRELEVKNEIINDPLQAQLFEIWKSILGTENIGSEDDFFELGGHSFLAIKMEAEMEKNGIPIQSSDIYIYRTIQQQALFVKNLRP